ncbi:MAG TPA: zf-HC2 domain-containing protein [Gemmatimonadaceae bacterium]|jgi:hypothetical protein|nr:zf-HC2 domain-containing protein [Gemmatimonadaceae bacterium]
MQHLDEGTIHAWLDGALTPDEAAQADAHVKDCPQCQAAVAEARGFIAASSRILTALDDAPRGVIPVAAPRRRVQPWIWRVAATALVVATGTLLLVKQRGGERTIASRAESAAPAPATANAGLPVAADSVAAGTAAASPVVSESAQIRAVTPRATGLSTKSLPTGPASKQGVVLDRTELPPSTGERRVDADSRARMSTTTLAPAPAAVGGRAFSAIPGALSAESAPREVGSTRSIGRTQTFYEIAPGDTVVLEEQSSVALQNVVVTGAATARQLQPQAQRTNKTASAAAVESEQKAAPAAAPPPAPALPSLQDAPTAERHSISWLDPSTRRVVVLSGRHSQEELQKIREQIQRLRDAAQAKRNPD